MSTSPRSPGASAPPDPQEKFDGLVQVYFAAMYRAHDALARIYGNVPGGDGHYHGLDYIHKQLLIALNNLGLAGTTIEKCYALVQQMPEFKDEVMESIHPAFMKRPDGSGRNAGGEL